MNIRLILILMHIKKHFQTVRVRLRPTRRTGDGRTPGPRRNPLQQDSSGRQSPDRSILCRKKRKGRFFTSWCNETNLSLVTITCHGTYIKMILRRIILSERFYYLKRRAVIPSQEELDKTLPVLEPVWNQTPANARYT